METQANQHTHPSGGNMQMADCPACLVKPGASTSAKVAWGVAVTALLLLVAVFFLRPGTTGSTIAVGSGLFLLGALLCPLTMGAMMFFMMRKGH